MSGTRKLHIAFDPIYAHPLPEGHRFPMLKYELIREQLLYEGTIRSDNLFQPTPCPDEVVLFTHTREYLDKLQQQTLSPKEQRQIGFPQSPQLTLRELIITQGTIDCCHYALDNGTKNADGDTADCQLDYRVHNLDRRKCEVFHGISHNKKRLTAAFS